LIELGRGDEKGKEKEKELGRESARVLTFDSNPPKVIPNSPEADSSKLAIATKSTKPPFFTKSLFDDGEMDDEEKQKVNGKEENAKEGDDEGEGSEDISQPHVAPMGPLPSTSEYNADRIFIFSFHDFFAFSHFHVAFKCGVVCGCFPDTIILR